VIAETGRDRDKRGCAAGEGFRGEDEKEMVKETGQRRNPVALAIDLEGK
jgi:hypothetical protein